MSSTDPRYRAVVDGAPLAYVSDYLSFVGADSAGRVCFALDTNRGYDEQPPAGRGKPTQTLQAETAYAVLHDERTGWVPLAGVQRYPHPGPDVTALPDSAWFAWSGSADAGWTVRSELNDLELTVAPLTDRLVGTDDSSLFVMRTAAATLHWQDRTLRGRLIHEGLASTGLNLLTRRTFKGLAGLEFLYLLAGDPTGPAGDVYLQKTLAPQALAGMPAVTGFAAPAYAAPRAATALDRLVVTTTAHAPAAGAYRWPTRWEARWHGAGPDALADTANVVVHAARRTVIGAYGVAGFGMSILEGRLTRADGSTLPLYGLAEVLAGGPLMRALARR